MSLVGSEMCIRDSPRPTARRRASKSTWKNPGLWGGQHRLYFLQADKPGEGFGSDAGERISGGERVLRGYVSGDVSR